MRGAVFAGDAAGAVVAVPRVPVVERGAVAALQDSERHVEPRDGEHHPDGDRGGQVGVRLLQRESQRGEHDEAVEAGGLQGDGLDEAGLLAAHHAQRAAQNAAHQRQQDGAQHVVAVDELEHVHVDVDAHRDVEDGGEQQEGLDDPGQQHVGHDGPEAVDHQPRGVGEEDGGQPDLEVVDGDDARAERGVGVRLEVLAQHEDPQRGCACNREGNVGQCGGR